jgi:beta-lactamase class A
MIDAEQAKNISVYFKDLKHGTVVGINELADFAPASLLKIPLSIAYLSLVERQPSALTDQIRYTRTTEMTAFPSKAPFEDGTSYSAEQLLSGMLANSDNGAYLALAGHFLEPSRGGPEDLIQIYKELGIVTPLGTTSDILSVRSYAGLFRTLYNGSYLTPKSSEKILGLLSTSDFTDGLIAGVPHGTVVAHKFGEREYAKNGKLDTADIQLHDCGIVYYPNNPYILCVMTRGSSIPDLTASVRQISHMVYQEMESRLH